MRILSLIQKPQRRGAETFAADLGRWLRRAGHDARTLALYRHHGMPLELDPADVLLDGDEAGSQERVVDVRLVWRILAHLRQFRPDVVMANGGRTVKYAAAVRWLAPSGRLWVYRNIDSPRFWLKRPLARLAMPLLVRGTFDAAIGVSQTTLEEVRAIYGFHGASEAIENGIDFDRIAPREGNDQLDVAPGRLKLLWAGAMGPQKRPDVAVEVLAKLDGGCSLTMLGEGPWLNRVERLVVARGLGDRVRLLGNRQDIGDLMRAVDLFIVTSDTDGIPAVALEAQHCGLPVVAFDVGGLRECIVPGQTGALVAHGDQAAMVAAILDLESKFRARLAAQCRDHANRFAIERIGQRYLDFFERHLRRRGQSVTPRRGGANNGPGSGHEPSTNAAPRR